MMVLDKVLFQLWVIDISSLIPPNSSLNPPCCRSEQGFNGTHWDWNVQTLLYIFGLTDNTWLIIVEQRYKLSWYFHSHTAHFVWESESPVAVIWHIYRFKKYISQQNQLALSDAKDCVPPVIALPDTDMLVISSFGILLINVCYRQGGRVYVCVWSLFFTEDEGHHLISAAASCVMLWYT